MEKLAEHCRKSGLDELAAEMDSKKIFTESYDLNIEGTKIHFPAPQDLAFIQFSSGSTSDPKGIMLSHQNLLTNIRAMIRGSRVVQKDSTLSWMPLTHDMGLIGFHLVPLTAGIDQYIMPTQLFIRNPLIWIDKTDEHRATLLSSPNFGYKHFLGGYKKESGKKWDLTCVRLLFNGAEPISYQLCNEFLNSMEVFSLSRETMFPVYGLAEASLAVSFPPVEEEVIPVAIGSGSAGIGDRIEEVPLSSDRKYTVFVDLGFPVDDCEVMIGNDKSEPYAEGTLGRVFIKGDNVTRGYYNDQIATQKAINRQGWLDTGDLGYIRNGRLVVTGRSKDIIFINGQNHYPHDIEAMIDGFEGIRLGEAAVCGVYNRDSLREDLVIFLRHRGSPEDFARLARKLKHHVNKKLGCETGDVVPIKSVPKTTSGKIQRYKLGQAYSSGEFSTILSELTKIYREWDLGKSRVEPKTENEKLLHGIWCELLGRKDISIDDDFFAIGGDSLKSVKLAAAIKQAFGKEVDLSEIFEKPTIASLSAMLENLPAEMTEPMAKGIGTGPCPLSTAQKRIYLLNQIDPDDLSYNLPAAFMMEGTLDRKKLEDCFRELISRHQMLRTSFELADEGPIQVINENAFFELGFEKINPRETESRISQFIRPFDLGGAPLMRAKLLQISDTRHLLIFDIHHIIADGTSLGILIKEISELYQGAGLPEIKAEYTDFVTWENSQRQKKEYLENESYWLEKFKDDIPTLDLPLDNQRPPKQHHDGGSLDLKLSSEQTKGIKALAEETGSTINMTLLAVISTLLSRYSGQEDLIIGTPVAGRLHSDVQNTVGMFVNTLPLRFNTYQGKTFSDLQEEVKGICIEAYSHQSYPFAEMVEKAMTKRDLSRNPIFDVMFIYQNIDLPEFKMPGLSIKQYSFDKNTAQVDITFEAKMENENLSMKIEYSRSLFDRERIERMCGHFKQIVSEVTRNPGIRLGDIDILTPEEKHQLLEEFNQTAVEYDRNRTVIDMFEEAAEKHREGTALVYGGREMSYGELNEWANAISRRLRGSGVGRESLVGLLMERGFGMIAGILGVLKSGGAYLPIDPDYPAERISYMLEDSGANWLLGDGAILAGMAYGGCKITLEETWEGREGTRNPERVSGPGDLAYVIYTSGSTGRPKGVMVEHGQLMNFAQGMQGAVGFDSRDSILSLTTISFDIFFLESILPLLKGMKMIISGSKQQRDPGLLSHLIAHHEIKMIQITPSRLQMLMNDDENGKCLNGVTKLLIGGESLPSVLLEKIKGITKARIFNMYGPTETTIWSSVKELTVSNKVTLGRPIANTKLFIKNGNNLQPIGVPGELFIGGNGLARGYINAPELTAEKFTVDVKFDKERIYKTGDLARWLPDGEVEFLGRNDNQVKIRGFRIELGEIESRMAEYPGIKEAAVAVKTDSSGNYAICGYYSAKKQNVETSGFRIFLSKTLPDYMVPSYLTELQTIPQTHNGKIDRKALPEPTGYEDKSVKFPPRNRTDSDLLEIWKRILQNQNIGIDDNFFWLGGHSLKATVLAAEIRKKIGISIPLSNIFESPTIRQLSDYISKGYKGRRQIDICPSTVKDRYSLSPAQKRLYVLHQLENDSTVYNLPAAFWVEGYIDKNKLECAFTKLIARHESLRTFFIMDGDQPAQKISNNDVFSIDAKDVQPGDMERAVKEFIRPFDLEKPPLLRVSLLNVEGKQLLLFDMHHIISDGESLGVMVKEIAAFYDGMTLDQLKIQYRDYAEWQNGILQDTESNEQEKYWLDKFSGHIPVLDLPSDRLRPAVQSFEGGKISFELDKDVSESLKGMALENGATLYMTLLAVYSTLIYRYSGQEDQVIGSPVAGRTQADLQQLIGMFVNTIALRVRPEGIKRFDSYLKEIKEETLSAFDNQDYPFDRLVEKLNITRDVSRNPLFDVMFAMQETDDSEIDFSGIKFKPYRFDTGVSQFDMTMDAVDTCRGISLTIEYSRSLFDRERIERMCGHFKQIVSEVTRNPGIRLGDIDILTPEEKHQLLEEFNQTAVEYDRNRTVIDMFEEAAEKHREGTALVYGGREMSYGELNEWANAISRRLRGSGVGRESLVGLLMERGFGMIAGILGVLKSGGAYLPIDPDYPAERISYMLEDSGANWLLGDGAILAGMAYGGCKITLEETWEGREGTRNPERVSGPGDLAYVIYTSGSTGRPKGVMVEHGNLSAYLAAFNHEYGITEKDVFLQQASYTFDTYVEEIYPALLSGGKVIIISREGTLDSEKLHQELSGNAVTVVSCSPLMLAELNRLPAIETIRLFISGGDVLKNEHIDRLVKKYRIYNSYGPTESTVCASYYRCRSTHDEPIAIGKPVSNYKIYLLDGFDKLVPLGVSGEICIAGPGVTRGYLNRETLTKEKFAGNLFGEGERIYRSGDLGRWRSDGNLEFWGRKDDQVKIRGYRIELGEIEKALTEYPAIETAVVVDSSDDEGSKYLAAYFTSIEEVTIDEIREHLLKQLPEYMVPGHFLRVEKIPLTSHGKVDKKALRGMGASASLGTEYIAPETEVEKILAGLWKDVLNAEAVGVNDNFFSLGGDSIKAIQISSRLNQYGYKFDVSDLFKASTIKELAPKCTKKQKQSEQGLVTGDVYVTPIQQYFFSKNFSDKHHWNQAVMLRSLNELNVEAVSSAFTKIIEHHDALRMIFQDAQGKVGAYNRALEGDLFSIREIDVKDSKGNTKDLTREIDLVQEAMDLQKGPLVSLGIFHTNSGDHLLIAIHHLVVDGVSWRILLEDFITAYEQVLKGLPIVLPPKTDSFQKWSENLMHFSRENELLRENDYWLEIDHYEAKLLPAGNKIDVDIHSQGAVEEFKLGKEHTERLMVSNKAYNTETVDLLLTSLAVSISDWTGSGSVKLSMEGHGRERIDVETDISRTIGWFTSLYPVVLDISKYSDIGGRIKQVKETLRKIPRKGMGYGILKYISPARENFTGRSPEICFNYLGQFEDKTLGGLFEMSEIPPGNMMSPQSEREHALDINCEIMNGEMRLRLGYNRRRYDQKIIRSILSGFEKSITEIIRRCLDKGETELTAADYGDKDLSLEELGDILDMVDSI
jgi:amino acid adenylation domain-containing protein/non-ribosomal peptide synthase protein (TIGR01720 family)